MRFKTTCFIGYYYKKENVLDKTMLKWKIKKISDSLKDEMARILDLILAMPKDSCLANEKQGSSAEILIIMK